MFTSLHKGVSVFDFCIIFLDLASLIFFQNLILGYYMKHKNKRTQDVKSILDKQILLSAFPMLNGSRILLPVSMIVNFIEIGRIAIFALF